MKPSELKDRIAEPQDLVSQAAMTIDSAYLFGDKKLILVRHRGDWYRLMITRQDKLILTK